jgi:branched-chain amino acid transport system substrate-binding protein
MPLQNTGITRRAGLGLLAGAGASPLLARGLGGDITIGALLSLTGDWSTLGITSKALLETAVAEINAFFDATSTPGRVTLRVEDTKLDANLAVNGLRSLAGAGAKLVIGPQSSAEARAILPTLAELDVIAISQGSTAGSLSLPGDNLLRFVPDDSIEGTAIVAATRAAGIRTIVPAWRADAGNRGLEIAVRKQFTAAGGVMTAGVEYPADSTLNAPNVVAELAKQASAASGKTAIFLASFDEVVDVFRAASSVAALGALPWYGSDGVALSVPLASDATASAFAVQTGYVAPTLLRSEAARPKWQPLVQAVTTKTGIEPDAFALAAYDACWCALLARQLAGGNYTPIWKTFFTQTAENFFGATGWGRLNANGDRAYGDFEFWALRRVDGKTKWTSVATFDSGVYATRG